MIVSMAGTHGLSKRKRILKAKRELKLRRE